VKIPSRLAIACGRSRFWVDDSGGVIYTRLIRRVLHRRGQGRLLGEGRALLHAGNEALLVIELLRLIYTSVWLQRRKKRTITGKDIQVRRGMVHVEYQRELVMRIRWLSLSACGSLVPPRRCSFIRLTQKRGRPRLPASWIKVCIISHGQFSDRSDRSNVSDQHLAMALTQSDRAHVRAYLEARNHYEKSMGS